MALDVKISYSWTNYCRLCLSDDGIMLPLFDGEGLNRLIGLKIESCLQLLTYEGDPLPTKICHKCLYKVDQAYEFRVMALKSFERIKDALLPLKHVPDVEQYLTKSGYLNKLNGPDGASYVATSSRSEGINVGTPKIRVKSESELMGDAQCSSWTPHLESPFSYTSSTPKMSSSREPTSSSENPNHHDTLKRKRFCLPPDSTSFEVPPKSISPVLKKPRMKRSSAGPASRKKSAQASQWKCVFCQSYFSSKDILNSHLEKCLKCAVCCKDFSSFREKVIHEADHISVSVVCDLAHLKWECPQCPERFASSVMLSTHSKYNHSPLVRSKTICGYESESNAFSGDNLPTTTVSGIKKIEFKGSRRSKQNNNVSQSADDCPQSGGPHSCHTCHELFRNERMLLDHEKIIHGRFRCSTCSEVFDSQKGLNSHKRCHIVKQTSIKTYFDQNNTHTSPVKKKGFSCNICYEEYDDEDGFVLHLYHHATEQSDDESMPSKKSRKVKKEKQSNSMSSVSSSDVSDNASEQFTMKCKRCNVVCRSKEYYKVHLATHLSKVKTNFSCSGCNQDFRNVEALNRHACGGKCCLDCGQGLVEGEDHVCDNKCPGCDKVFKSARGQRLHYVSKHEKKVPNESGSIVTVEVLESEEDQVEEDVQSQNTSGGIGGNQVEEERREENQTMGKSNEMNESEVHHVINSGRQNELIPGQESGTREDSSENGQSDSDCHCNDSDSLGDSPSVVRLPPDGASIVEPPTCEFDSDSIKDIGISKLSENLEANQNSVCVEATF